MRNKITDLNNHLFAQLERLSDEDLTPEQLDLEINRSKAITNIAANVIESNKITIDAMRLLEKTGADISNYGDGILQLNLKS